MDNSAIADVLDEMATLMELTGANAFRCNAYRNAGRQIERMDASAADLSDSGELTGVKGVGDRLAASISELVSTGRMQAYDDLRASVPEGLIEVLEIPGLGAKRIHTLNESLGVADVDALEKACVSGQVEKLSGFGKKTSDKILEGIAFLQKHRGRFLCSTALAQANAMLHHLQGVDGVQRAAVAGSVRRCCETSKDVDIVVSSSDASAPADAFVAFPGVAQVTGRGETKVSVVLESGMTADLRIVEDEAFPYALHHFTGSKEHNTQMRQRAKSEGLKLNEYGLFRGGTPVACANEAALFGSLGLPFIPPELREGAGEIELGESGSLPVLVEPSDLKGTLHVHTRFSDGRATVEVMAETARDLGYAYIAICDHSRAAAYANGMPPERVREQWEEIERINDALEGITILKGIEVDILGDGRLDYDDDLLAGFDLVVASVHSQFSMTEAQATQRVVNAMANPYVDILGHPTGRLLLSREGYPLNVQELFSAAVEYSTAIELNSNPRRMDLDWRHLKGAASQRIPIAVNTDAHGPEALQVMDYGIGAARKAGLRAADVLNAWDLPTLLEWKAARTGAG
jgi:DNA polymerase (family 10)